MAKITKPNYTRGQIFDKLAECFGESVLGMYEGKLRVEIVNEEGDVIQFSLAPVIHKTLIEESECDLLIPVVDQMAAYETANAAKTAENLAKKAKTDAAKTKKSTPKVDKPDEVASAVTVYDEEPVALTEDEQAKLNELANLLASGSF